MFEFAHKDFESVVIEDRRGSSGFAKKTVVEDNVVFSHAKK